MYVQLSKQLAAVWVYLSASLGATMGVVLGFDPGGQGCFGWCVCDDAPALPLNVRSTGLAENARTAVSAAIAHVAPGEPIVSAGIDAPLFWVTTGDRNADRIIRGELRSLGAPSPGGTVQHVNSLRGACLVQGMLTGALLCASWPDLPITESHPKALLWQIGYLKKDQQSGNVSLSQLVLWEGNEWTEHERDAAIASVSAWAMVHKPQGWRDLYPQEGDTYSLVKGNIGYWMPRFADG